jgi:hypothetical protein
VLIWIVASVAVVARVPWIVVGSIVLIAVAPVPGVVILALATTGHHLLARSKTRRSDTETTLLRGLAASVGAGLTLRQAIVTAPDQSVSGATRRLCLAGASMAEVGAALGSELALNGRRLASLCAMSELTGAPFGGVLTAAAERSARMEQSVRNRRSSLAQVRFSAWVVGIAPLVLTGLVVLTQGIPEPRGAVILVPMVVGVVLQVTGTAVVFLISGRAT